MPNDTSRRIYELRKQQGLTLEQVADVVGVGKSTVRKWETGMIANMKRDKIALLAKALHTTPAYLIGWDDASDVLDNENSWALKIYEIADKCDVDMQAEIYRYAIALCNGAIFEQLTDQEKTLVRLFREASEEGKMRMIQSVLNVHDAEIKSSGSAGNSSLA